MTLEEQIMEIWTPGNIAPYNLYDGCACDAINGFPPLVEATGDGSPPVISRGQMITQEISIRIYNQIHRLSEYDDVYYLSVVGV